MKTAAVITEFNPLHNGHAYFLGEVRHRSGADFIVAVMSGDFVQRGEPAIFDKYVRAEAALSCGADLVLELPVRYACANAGDFALGGVGVINALGTVDELWFGSEYGEIGLFEEMAGVLSTESEGFKDHLSEGLKAGLPYPKARASAIADSMRSVNTLFRGGREEALDFLEAPNNILGLEYCLALRKMNSRIRPATLKRKGSGHNSRALLPGISSATALRERLFRIGLWGLEGSVPAAAFDIYRKYSTESRPVSSDDFSLMLKYKLMSCSVPELAAFSGVSEDLALRIQNKLNSFQSFTQFADLLKTRNLTRTHINRALLHILLDIRADHGNAIHGNAISLNAQENTQPRYAHILGMGSCGELLSGTKEKGSIVLCSTPSVIKDGSYNEDLFASNLYETVRSAKSGTRFVHEFERKLIK